MTLRTRTLVEVLIESICEFERAKDPILRQRLRETTWIALEDVLTDIRRADHAQNAAEPLAILGQGSSLTHIRD